MRTIIPEILCTEYNRFLLLDNQKRPFEKDWTTKNNYHFNDEKLVKYLEYGGNYGVLCGKGNIIVIDFDNEEYQNIIMPLLPKTFTVKTGSGKYHLYYQSNDTKSFKIMDKHKTTIIDMQGDGKQVVGANSLHPNGNRYTVEVDMNITLIDMGELKAVLYNNLPKDWLPKQIVNDESKDKIKSINKINNNPTINDIKKKLKPSDLLIENKIDVTKNPTQCPLHDSKGGKCFSFNDDVWHCFHCDKSGDVITLYQELYSLDFKKALRELCNKLNIEYNPLEYLEIKKGFSKNGNILTQVEAFVENNPIYYDKNRIWWIWSYDEHKWLITDEIDILNLVRKEININVVGKEHRGEIIESLKLIGRDKKPKEPPREWIQFKNSIVDINTGKHFPSSAEYFFTNPIDWDVGKSKETPIIDKIFMDWVGGDKQLLYEILAYCLLRDYPLHRLFCLTGSGRNGKSKYLELISRFIGFDNRTSTELDVLLNRPFESSKLYKKLVCLMGETNYTNMKNTSLLKKLTGQDTIGFEFKNKNPFDDYNYAKIIIATNGIPITNDKSEGFYRRWIIIDFNNKFEEGKDILSTIPKVEYENLCLKCIELLPKLLKCCNFTGEENIELKAKKYEERSNPLNKFLREKTINDVEGFVFKYEFKERFLAWQKQNSFRTWSDHEIGTNMKEHFEEKQKGEHGYRAWLGINWKDNVIKNENIDNSHLSQLSHPIPSRFSIETELILGVNPVKGVINSRDLINLLKFNEIFNKEHLELLNINVEKAVEEGLLLTTRTGYMRL